MAVQAQYPANVLLLNRAEADSSGKDMDFPPASLLDQSPAFFTSNGANVNPRKRGRDATPAERGVPMMVYPSPQAQQQQLSIFSLQPQAAVQRGLFPSVMMGTSQAPPPVSTGLCLALDEQNVGFPHDSTLSASSEALAAQFNKQMNEIEQFLFAQGEHLRRALAEKRQRHHRALLAAAEESIGRRLREKELEIERAVRRSAELEDRLARLCTETMAWQAKAMAEQAAAASLHAQIQQAAAAVPPGNECCGESAAEDAESAFIDPDRLESPEPACRACFQRPALVVLIPCRHLCLCTACDANGAGDVCPVCGLARTGSVQVVLS